jgi:hypothetical protein
MPSAKSVFKMRAAIDWCSREYFGLPKILKASSLPDSWIYEVMAKWDVSKRTATEYLMVAAEKIKLREKDRARQEEIMAKELSEQEVGEILNAKTD